MTKISESVLRAAQKINKLINLAGEEIDLTPRQVDVILILAEEPGLSQVDIMERSSMDRSTMSSVITLMESKGLVERVPSQKDKRALVVDLTLEGRALIKPARKLKQDVEATLEGVMRQPVKTLSDLVAISEIELEGKK